jgi:hypothetical protein
MPPITISLGRLYSTKYLAIRLTVSQSYSRSESYWQTAGEPTVRSLPLSCLATQRTAAPWNDSVSSSMRDAHGPVLQAARPHVSVLASEEWPKKVSTVAVPGIMTAAIGSGTVRFVHTNQYVQERPTAVCCVMLQAIRQAPFAGVPAALLPVFLLSAEVAVARVPVVSGVHECCDWLS